MDLDDQENPEVRIANTDDDRARKLVRPWLAHVWIQKVGLFMSPE